MRPVSQDPKRKHTLPPPNNLTRCTNKSKALRDTVSTACIDHRSNIRTPPQPNNSSPRSTKLELLRAAKAQRKHGGGDLRCLLDLKRSQAELIPQRLEPRHRRCWWTNDWIICLQSCPGVLRSAALRSGAARNVEGVRKTATYRSSQRKLQQLYIKNPTQDSFRPVACRV